VFQAILALVTAVAAMIGPALPATPTVLDGLCSPIKLVSPWQAYVRACQFQNGTIRVQNITAYTVLNLEYRSPGLSQYPVVPLLDPGEVALPQDAAWRVVNADSHFVPSQTTKSGTHTMLLTPGVHLVIRGPDFYLATFPAATTALYSAFVIKRYEASVESAAAAKGISLPGPYGIRQDADKCAKAAGAAFSADRQALSGSINDMKAGVERTIGLSECKDLLAEVKRAFSGTGGTAADEAEQEAAYADRVSSYVSGLVTEKWWTKVRGSLFTLGEELIRAH